MTPAALQRWTPGTPAEDLSTALFDGILVEFNGLEPVKPLVRRVRTIIEDVFETANPLRAEARMAPAMFRKAASRARHAVAHDSETNRHWRDTLASIGYDPDSNYLDRIRLRVVPSRKEAHGRVIRPLPAHRDTWGSGIMAQINWWLPLYPLAATRTMVLWPDAFRRPVANDSAEWDYDTLMQGKRKDYPLLPVADYAPDEPGLPVLIKPGALLAFSAAHLHASAADASGLSRFSVDTRTVWAGDAFATRGAPNVDGAAGRAYWEWFTRPTVLPAVVHRSDAVHHQGGVSS